MIASAQSTATVAPSSMRANERSSVKDAGMDGVVRAARMRRVPNSPGRLLLIMLRNFCPAGGAQARTFVVAQGLRSRNPEQRLIYPFAAVHAPRRIRRGASGLFAGSREQLGDVFPIDQVVDECLEIVGTAIAVV